MDNTLNPQDRLSDLAKIDYMDRNQRNLEMLDLESGPRLAWSASPDISMVRIMLDF